FISAVNVFYRDIRFVVPLALQLWMYATPVVYPSSMIPDKWRVIYSLNPMAGVVEGFRWALFGTGQGPGLPLLVSVVMVLALLTSGLFFFKRMENTFADVV
ncbi:MAG: ABC transporter permease, partial [Chloroflexi bacterium]|nr:ABC transporter permease [Chloroflexota bacterium]